MSNPGQVFTDLYQIALLQQILFKLCKDDKEYSDLIQFLMKEARSEANK